MNLLRCHCLLKKKKNRFHDKSILVAKEYFERKNIVYFVKLMELHKWSIDYFERKNVTTFIAILNNKVKKL